MGRRTVRSPSWERATRLVFPRHSQYSAHTREMAAITERLWERGHEQDSSKARRVGWEASALTEVLWGQLVPQALGH